MTQRKCTECGQIFDENLNECPNCGCPANECECFTLGDSNTIKPFFKTDWADKIYECGALYWETLTKRYFKFTGRASRLEYWSFILITLWLMATTSGISIFFTIIPLFAVSIRRLHDINRSGWWILVPWVSFFFQFKKSDEGENDYGTPYNINL